MMNKPIVKWAGGKRQLLEKLIESMPPKFERYYEPFIGGGALMLTLEPKKATIGDINEDLIAVYKCMGNRDLFTKLLTELDKHEKKHSEEYYYYIRSKDREECYKEYTLWEKAARTIYLNKSCFNGLFRVNTNGHFNVPSGKKQKVSTYDKDNMFNIHEYFTNNNIELVLGDFEKIVRDAKSGDFVYFDPPYDSFDDKESFTAYTKFDFNKEDQIRLAKLFRDLSSKGVYVMLSNHNTKLINDLYADYKIRVVSAKRMINSDVNGRNNIEEVIITNY